MFIGAETTLSLGPIADCGVERCRGAIAPHLQTHTLADTQVAYQVD
jgi:hypothetical protein